MKFIMLENQSVYRKFLTFGSTNDFQKANSELLMQSHWGQFITKHNTGVNEQVLKGDKADKMPECAIAYGKQKR